MRNIDSSCCFVQLSLLSNSIHASGVSHLVDDVNSGRVTYILDLSDNPLGLEGYKYVCDMLNSSHCRLHTAILCQCQLTLVDINDCCPDASSLSDVDSPPTDVVRDVGQHTCKLPQTFSITCLSLNGNTFTGEGIHILVDFMYSCSSLTDLRTCECDITSDDLRQLLSRLVELGSSFSGKLKQWNIAINQIGDGGMLALSDHVPSLFPCICISGLFKNPVSKEVSRELSTKLMELRKVISY